MASKRVRSVWNAVQILDTFRPGKSRSLSEVCREMGLPKSSAHDLLGTLAEGGLVEKDGDSSRFRLGIKLIELGNRARSNFPLNRLAAPSLHVLHQRLDETVNLTVFDRDEVFYVDCYESSRVLRTYSSIGERAPLYCTAVGKAILAFLPEGEIGRILSKTELRPFTPNTITDRERLRRELERTTGRGYSVDDMEHEEGVRCVGAPLRDRGRRVFAAISVSGPAQRLTVDREGEIAAQVLAAAREISRRLGCEG